MQKQNLRFLAVAISTLAIVTLWMTCCQVTQAADIVLASGKIEMQAPDAWQSKQPRFTGIVSHEFVIKATDGDARDGRATIGPAGGNVEDNIRRWYGQYTQPDGKATAERAVRKKIKLSGQDVHYIDVKGTYSGSRFSNEPSAPNYRLVAAIIETNNLGSFYLKFYGPEKTVTANEKAFKSIIDSLEIK